MEEAQVLQQSYAEYRGDTGLSLRCHLQVPRRPCW